MLVPWLKGEREKERAAASRPASEQEQLEQTLGGTLEQSRPSTATAGPYNGTFHGFQP